jgi:autotransporter-associated beta strand protein
MERSIHRLSTTLLAATALAMVASGPTTAQDATWLPTPPSNQYTSGPNWSTGTVPGLGDIATFETSSQAGLMIDTFGTLVVDGWVFAPGASDYTFTVVPGTFLVFDGAGIVMNGGSAILTNNYGLQFSLQSSAGSSYIINNNLTEFYDESTAGDANIINNNVLQFTGTSTIGSATVINYNGVYFYSGATGDTGRIVNNQAAAFFDISFTSASSFMLGSIEGAGTAFLGDKRLIVGADESSTTFSGVISDGGLIPGTGAALEKVGHGTLILTGINTYTGSTEIAGGALIVNGSIASSSDLIVGADGTVGGTGILPATSISGALAPGNSIGTLTVEDSLSFAPGSTYEVEVSATGADRTDVVAGSGGPGSADLAGGTVVPIYEPGSYIAKSYVILTAVGGLGGTEFAALASTAPTGFTQELVYSGDDTVELVLDLEMRPEPEPEPEPERPDEPGPEEPEEPGTPQEPSPSPNPYTNLSRNQDAVRNAIVGYFDANGGIPAEFAALTPEGLTQASAETAAAAIAIGQQAADQFLSVISVPQFGDTGPSAPPPPPGPLAYADGDTATSRVERAFGAGFGTVAAPASYWQSWGAAYGAGARSDGDTAMGSSDMTAQNWGIAAGNDIAFSGTSLGVALGGGWGSYELENGFGGGKVGSLQAGIRGTQEVGAAYLSGALAYGYHAFTTSRTVTGERYEADFSGHSISGRAETGWRFAMPATSFIPYGAVETVALYTPAYGESASGAGLFALNYQAESTVSTRLELGARVSHTIDLDTGKLTLSGRAAWQHNLNPDRKVTAGFATLVGTSFVTNAAAASRNSLLLTLGADYAMTGDIALGITAEAALGDRSSAFAGKASVKIRW